MEELSFEFMEPILARLRELGDGLIRHIPEIVAGLLVLALAVLAGLWGARALVRWNRLSGLRPSVRSLYGKLFTVVIVTLGFVAAAVIVFPDITPGRLFTMLGVGSIAVGFALKDVLENFLAGMILLGRKTIEIGDVIECAGTQGAVDDITIRDTYLRTPWNERIVVPNALLFEDPVRILTWQDNRRVRSPLGVAYGTDLDAACELIESTIAQQPSVRGDRGVEALVTGFGDSSIDIEMIWWTASAPLDVMRSKSEVHRAVKRALDANDIEIPFPQRVLHLDRAAHENVLSSVHPASDRPTTDADPVGPTKA